mgnify:CR=1 FL=1
MTRWAKAAAVACVVLAWSCAGEGLRSLFQECDKVGQNTFVRDTMKDIYLWYRELPDLDPAGYDSPEAYLEAIRYKRYDTHFSFITSKAAAEKRVASPIRNFFARLMRRVLLSPTKKYTTPAGLARRFAEEKEASAVPTL